jgi:hypothetical protein
MSERNFWVSWYSPDELGSWELHSPWWVSGWAVTETEDVQTICAAIKAKDEDDARTRVLASYDKPPATVAWRFVEERPADWTPFNDRFLKADWMVWP